MRASFAYVTLLAGLTAASNLTAVKEKAHMQMCVGKIDFNKPNAMAEVDVCTLKAKQFLQQLVLQSADCELQAPSVTDYEFVRQSTVEIGTITIRDYDPASPLADCSPEQKQAAISAELVDDAEDDATYEEGGNELTINPSAAAGTYTVTIQDQEGGNEYDANVTVTDGCGIEQAALVGTKKSQISNLSYTIGKPKGELDLTSWLVTACADPAELELDVASGDDWIKLVGNKLTWETSDTSKAGARSFTIKVKSDDFDGKNDISAKGTLTVAEPSIVGGDADFTLTTSIAAVTAASGDTALIALETDFKLQNKAKEIPKDHVVFMYASFKNLGATTVAESWETVSCLVEYGQVNSTAALTKIEIADLTKVRSYLGTCELSDAANPDEPLKDVCEDDEVESDAEGWAWEANELEANGFDQLYTASVAQNVSATTEVNCAVTSARGTPATNHQYKIGDKVKIRGGYKIRASKSSDTSLFSNDRAAAEWTLVGTEAGAMSLLGSAFALTLASLLAF